jgi:hypothetical protein
MNLISRIFIQNLENYFSKKKKTDQNYDSDFAEHSYQPTNAPLHNLGSLNISKTFSLH